MSASIEPTEARVVATCPFLTPGGGDFLWIRPVGAYCRRPGRPVRVPADATLDRVCATAEHLACSGYREGEDALIAAAFAEGPTGPARSG